MLRRFGQHPEDVRDIGLGTSSDDVIARHAVDNRVPLLTCDFDFADVRAYPPADYPGIVVVERPDNATVPTVLNLVERLLLEPRIIQNLEGRLVIVSTNRIRVRPALPDIAD